VFVIFETGSCFMSGLAWPMMVLLFVLSCIAEMTGLCHHSTQPLVEMGSHECFAGTGLKLILCISVCQVARIRALSHCAWLGCVLDKLTQQSSC
jgi:hypothetical protein